MSQPPTTQGTSVAASDKPAGSFPASALQAGQQFRTTAGQGRNYKAVRVTPYETIGKAPTRTMLEVETESAGYLFVFELTTPLYHAK
jgi:hypothetical protein